MLPYEVLFSGWLSQPVITSMLPTIDISVLGVLGAIGAFFAWLWGVVVRVFEWCQNKFVLFWLGSRWGRAVLEVGLFAVAYAALVYGIRTAVAWAGNQLYEFTAPAQVTQAWKFLNLVFPGRDLVLLVVDFASLMGAYLSMWTVYTHYQRVWSVLLKVMKIGRI